MMKYSEAKPGHIFIIRLEDGDILHEAVEVFASSHGIQAAALIVLAERMRAASWLWGRSKIAVAPSFQWNMCSSAFTK